jgi:hypothetical protein
VFIVFVLRWLYKFTDSLQGLLINATMRVKVKTGSYKLIKYRFKRRDHPFEAGMDQNADAPDGRKAFLFRQLSHTQAISQNHSSSFLKSTGYNRYVCCGEVRGTEPIHYSRIGHRSDSNPPIAYSLTKLKVSGPSLPLCDYLVIDLRNEGVGGNIA